MENEVMNNFSTTTSRLLSAVSFRKLLVYALISSGAFYYGGFDLSMFNQDETIEFFQTYAFLRFVSISLAIYILFYTIGEFLLRLLFHGYLKDKLLKAKNELQKQNSFGYRRNLHGLYSLFKILFKDYFYRLGFIEKNDLIGEATITEAEREELLNEILADCYKWICTMLHFILTLISVWQYHSLWILLISTIVLLFLIIIPIGAIIMVMNIDLLMKVRMDILKTKSL